MISRDGDGVELRHVLRGVLEDIGDDTHREFRRIDIGVTHHELLKDIVLYRTSHLLKLGSLLQTRIDVECKHRKYGTVHSHRYRHLIQGYTLEENLHILKRADRYTSLAYVTNNTLMISVITTMSSEVERN